MIPGPMLAALSDFLASMSRERFFASSGFLQAFPTLHFLLFLGTIEKFQCQLVFLLRAEPWYERNSLR